MLRSCQNYTEHLVSLIRCKMSYHDFVAGGSTILIKSEGSVEEELMDVLGVYRVVERYNNRPLFKQDPGENYVYYR